MTRTFLHDIAALQIFDGMSKPGQAKWFDEMEKAAKKAGEIKETRHVQHCRCLQCANRRVRVAEVYTSGGLEGEA